MLITFLLLMMLLWYVRHIRCITVANILLPTVVSINIIVFILRERERDIAEFELRMYTFSAGVIRVESE